MDRHTPQRLNVLVTHAEPLLAVGLAAALRPQADIRVFGHDDAPEAGEPIDVIVTDHATAMRLAAQARCHAVDRSLASARVMVVTVSDREQDVRLALQNGVHGYLLLGCPVDELVTGVRTLGRGGRYLCLAVAQRMAESLTREALTTREAEVLRLLARGQCNKAIARDLDIAVGTVKAHVTAIMGKLDANCRTQAASIAAQRGLVDGLAAEGFVMPTALPGRIAPMHAAAAFAPGREQRV